MVRLQGVAIFLDLVDSTKTKTSNKWQPLKDNNKGEKRRLLSAAKEIEKTKATLPNHTNVNIYLHVP